MNHNLLGNLALTGLKNNKKAVLPYILASAFTVMVMHILLSLIDSKYIMRDGVAVFKGANNIVMFVSIGSIVVGIFAVIFLFYGNQFVMKGYKKEIGLYGVLGLSRKNVSTVMALESLIISTSSIVLGVVAGAFMNKLMVLWLYRIIKQPFVSGMDFSLRGTMFTVIFFAIVFGICLIHNLLTVRLGNPIELLKSDNIGEKEPKVKYILLIIGTITLLLGYMIALSTDNTFVALGNLFKAMILVTIATYALFIAGSIFVLKLLKRNKKYYYQTKHFISVSNLMYRMKHNAAGLASICILSTGVILLLVCSTALFMLGEQNINSMFRRDVVLHGMNDEGVTLDEYDAVVTKAVKEAGISDSDRIVRKYYMDICNVSADGSIEYYTKGSYDFTSMRVLYVLTLDEYNLYTGQKETLDAGEILRYSAGAKVKAGENLNIYGSDYKIKKKISSKCLEEVFDPSMSLFDEEIIVIADNAEKEKLLSQNPESFVGFDQVYVGFNVSKETSYEQIGILKDTIIKAPFEASVTYKEDERSTFYSIYGGIFFVGIFLAALFLIATVMIIFYKQMSEGFEDKKRFEILSNAGLSEREAKGVIKSQVMLMFFLPVATAIIHMIVASKIIRLFLGMILYVDTLTFNLAIIVVSLIFLGVYTLVYNITSKQYYNIVYGKEA